MEGAAETVFGDAVRRFAGVNDPTGPLDILLEALDELPVGVALLEVPNLRFVYANKLYESWYQSDRRPLVGRTLDEALVAAPQVVQTFRDVAAHGRPAHFHNAEFVGLKNRPLVLPGDVTVWDWSIWPLKSSTRHVTHLLVSGYDVTSPAADRLNAQLAHEEGVSALLDVSRIAGAKVSIEDFFGTLSATVARVVGAGKVLFATAHDGVMTMQPNSFGFDDQVLVGVSVPCSPQGTALADRIVFDDFVFRAPIDASPEFEPYRSVLNVMDVSNAIAVSWRVGDMRLGLVAAFNSTHVDGFNDRDVYLMKTAAMAAGLVWQHRQAQARLAEAQEQERIRLKSSADQKAALERAKADFLRMASHEMRGPINVVSVYASMLAESLPGDSSAASRDAAFAINQKIRELNRMVDQVLEVSRLEDPGLRLNLSTFDLREIGKRAADGVTTPAQRHPLRLKLADQPILVHADQERMLMILQNLLDNAFKYSPEGGEVTCVVQRSGDQAEVLIEDQGVGIAQEDMPRLFGRFSRVGGEETDGIPGTGLGLYLSREAARLLGGDVTVQSEPGKGSVFRISLPALPSQA